MTATTLQSALVLPGGIPMGDKQRVAVSTVTYGTESTILNVASGGAIIDSIWLESPTFSTADGTYTVTLTNLKVTYDGASERTLTHGGVIFHGFRDGNSTGDYTYTTAPIFIPCKAAALNSAIIKINVAKVNITATTTVAVVYYSVL